MKKKDSCMYIMDITRKTSVIGGGEAFLANNSLEILTVFSTYRNVFAKPFEKIVADQLVLSFPVFSPFMRIWSGKPWFNSYCWIFCCSSVSLLVFLSITHLVSSQC